MGSYSNGKAETPATNLPSFEDNPMPDVFIPDVCVASSVEVALPTGVYLDGQIDPNPFFSLEQRGKEFARLGLDAEGLVAVSIALGGIPRAINNDPDGILHSFATEIQELYGTQAGGEE